MGLREEALPDFDQRHYAGERTHRFRSPVGERYGVSGVQKCTMPTGGLYDPQFVAMEEESFENRTQ